jgi:DNA ligase-1
MLASDFLDRERKGKVRYPASLQPKLDGVRCLATRSGALVTRLGNDLSYLEQVQRDVAPVLARLPPWAAALDGELYVHGAKFGHIVSLVKNRGLKGGEVQFHAFDVFTTDDVPFAARFAALERAAEGGRVAIVPCVPAASGADVDAALSRFEAEGYEGVMVRDPGSFYAPGKRSPSLCKYKRFLTEEFAVVGFKEAGGKDAGTAVLECETAAQKRFWVRPEGDRKSRAKLLADAPALVARRALLTVRFQELTADGKPRFPIGVAVRDYE